jgi:hypothetical protein
MTKLAGVFEVYKCVVLTAILILLGSAWLKHPLPVRVFGGRIEVEGSVEVKGTVEVEGQIGGYPVRVKTER